MRLALAEAGLALEAEEVPVGCVIVDRARRRVVGRGGNETNLTKNGTRHCEFVALEAIAASDDPTIRDIDLASQSKREH